MSRLLGGCRELLRNEQHEEAVPFLEEAVFRLEDDPEKKAQQTLAFSMFQLSDCWMKLGRYDEGGVGFRSFADLFEQDPQQVEARLLSAQCFSLAGWWEEAEEQAVRVLELEVVADDEGASALRLCAEARFEQGKWERHPSKLSISNRQLRVRQSNSNTLNRQRHARQHLLRMPPILYRTSQIYRHRRPR